MKRAFIHHAHMVAINLPRANHSQVSLRACSVSTVLFRFGTMNDRLSKMARQLTRLLLFCLLFVVYVAQKPAAAEAVTADRKSVV